MNKTEILVVGKNEEILQNVVRLINNNDQWNGIGASTDEEAIEKFHHRHFDMVLLTNGINEEEERKLLKLFAHQNPDIIIIQHYSDGSLLSNEISEALSKRRKESKPTVSFVDDALKNAGLRPPSDFPRLGEATNTQPLLLGMFDNNRTFRK